MSTVNLGNDVWNGAGRRIYMNEVGTRDGLQMEAAFVPTEDKMRWSMPSDAACPKTRSRPLSRPRPFQPCAMARL